jgi:3-hydroxyisobutyrate dehydrogenase-like beta-hydroxyacid dehydrogenase
MRESVGLIGIGLVGTALAENLVAAGFDVVGFARSAGNRNALARLGGRAAASAAAVGEAAERVILSLPDSPAVEAVLRGPDGLLAGVSRVRLILEYADRLGQELPLTRVHQKILARGTAAGGGDLDTSAVIQQLRTLTRGRRA